MDYQASETHSFMPLTGDFSERSARSYTIRSLSLPELFRYYSRSLRFFERKVRRETSSDFGAGNQNRTDDLVITNDVLYRLSHTSIAMRPCYYTKECPICQEVFRKKSKIILFSNIASDFFNRTVIFYTLVTALIFLVHKYFLQLSCNLFPFLNDIKGRRENRTQSKRKGEP